MPNLIQLSLRELVKDPSELCGAALMKRVEPIGTAAITEPALELNNQELPLPER